MPRDRMRIRMLLGEPILHFLLIGMALFAAYRWIAPRDSAGHRIVITEGVVNDLVTQHVAAKGRPPAEDELTHLVDAYVRDEILYREGVALRLDRDDIVVKRRVRQKIEVMVEEDGPAVVPTDADLSAYLAANKDQFFRPAILTFDQIFLGPATSGPEVVSVAAVTRDAVRNGVDPLRLGQPSLLPRRIAQSPADLVARDFGSSFALAVEKAPIGEWVGPIDSGFGAHYVRVLDRTPAATPPLAAVRDRVGREWENDRRRRARNDAYARMRRAYDVRIAAMPPSGRP
jgi:parvulin-like peptidyl-prolyl cis-trans isomerase-like protein